MSTVVQQKFFKPTIGSFNPEIIACWTYLETALFYFVCYNVAFYFDFDSFIYYTCQLCQFLRPLLHLQ